MGTTSDVRAATGADLAGIATALADAFHDDPVMAWLFGDDEARTRKRLQRFFAFEAQRHLRHPHVYTTDGHAGAACWDPPGQWKTRPLTMLNMAPLMVRSMGPRIRRALKGLGIIEKAHGRHPEHYYLAILGTRTDRQGEGTGSALMAPVLDHCDANGIGAYLESSKEANIPFYRRHGFEVTEELQMPSGPSVWGMWREPRPPEGP